MNVIDKRERDYLSESSISNRLSSNINCNQDTKPSFTENIYLNQKKKILEIMNEQKPREEPCCVDHADVKYK